jgi:hypothetical protein
VKANEPDLTMPDEKDRFGDKLRDRERAEEDRYFSAQDEAKLKRLREQRTAMPPLGLCPRCGAGLQQETRQGTTIDRCAGCGGLWLDRGELERLAAIEGESWLAAWFREVFKRGTG